MTESTLQDGAKSRIELECNVDASLEALGDAAEIWGAEWQRLGTGGRLALPVSAGLRQGLLAGQISTRNVASEKTELLYTVEESLYRVHVPALVVLLFGALGGVLTIFAPLKVELLQLVPVAVVFMIVAWFLVLARLKNRSTDEFFELVSEVAEDHRAHHELIDPSEDDDTRPEPA